MLQVVLILGSVAGFIIGIIGVMSIASDIQVGIAITGFFAGVVLLGLSGVVKRLDQIGHQLRADPYHDDRQ